MNNISREVIVLIFVLLFLAPLIGYIKDYRNDKSGDFKSTLRSVGMLLGFLFVSYLAYRGFLMVRGDLF